LGTVPVVDIEPEAIVVVELATGKIIDRQQ
jgi:hypothetical protein